MFAIILYHIFVYTFQFLYDFWVTDHLFSIDRRVMLLGRWYLFYLFLLRGFVYTILYIRIKKRKVVVVSTFLIKG